MSYTIQDLIKTKQIVTEAMAIVQTVSDILMKKHGGQGLSQLEKELLFDLEICYENGEEITKDIDAIVSPWEGTPDEVSDAS